MSDENSIVHVQIIFDKYRTQHYFCVMKNIKDQIVEALDLGDDIETVKKVVKILKDQFKGIEMPRGYKN